MEISKTIQARKIKFTASSCKLDFMKMSQEFRLMRAKFYNPMRVCFVCNYSFVDGDMIALAISDIGNKSLCQQCGCELINSENIVQI